MIATGQTILASDILALAVNYGTGSDGAITLDGTNTYAGFLYKTGNTYVALRDIYATNIAINSGVTLYMNGWKLYATGTASGSGNVNYISGNAGSSNIGGTAFVPGSATSYANGTTFGPLVNISGLNGGAGHVGTGGGASSGNGIAGTFDAGSVAGVGGSGGSSGPGGGSAGTTSVSALSKLGVLMSLLQLVMDYTVTGSLAVRLPSQATAGGGGDSNNSGQNGGTGGGSGASGGTIFMAIFNMTATWTITSIGGAGANGANSSGTSSGGGGAGAGGTGGTSILIYNTKSSSLTYVLTGGAGATGGTGGAGGTGAKGANTSTGTTGLSLSRYKIKIMQPNDHDLLIRVDENVKNLSREFSMVREGALKQISVLETGKLDKDDFTVYKKNNDIMIDLISKGVDTLKKYIYIGLGIILALQFIAIIISNFSKTP